MLYVQLPGGALYQVGFVCWPGWMTSVSSAAGAKDALPTAADDTGGVPPGRG